MENLEPFDPIQDSYENSAEGARQPGVESTVNQEPVRYRLPNLHFRHAEFISKRGFSNGLLRIPQEIFERYIAAYEETKRLGLVISKMEKEADQKDKKIKDIEEDRDKLMTEIIQQKQESAHQDTQKARYSGLLQQLQHRLQDIKAQFQNNYPVYGWIGTLLFLGAGFIFIKTDISIINTIAFNGLDMKPAEASIFALGFALLAIILKPLVDRIFEKPYQNGKTYWMHGLLISVGLITISALWIMGAYRNQAFVASKDKEVIESRLEHLNDELNRGLRASPDPEIIDLEKELKRVTASFSSPLVKWLFISSSILFAIAGAICFSIGVPSFRMHANRVSGKAACYFQKWYFQRRWKRSDEYWRRAENGWKIAEQRLAVLPNLAILQAEFKRIILDIQIAHAAQHQAHTDSVLAIYQDNYERGQRYIPSEEELAKFELLLAEQSGIIKPNYQLNRQFSGSNLFNSQYLHEYIRQKIHLENKQKNSGNV
ncbi:MAG TPA: hypothetical protein PKB07_06990 [Flavilitoribacter sp.]|nr:hypothetical protein [Flavilitoribacter sp.]